MRRLNRLAATLALLTLASAARAADAPACALPGPSGSVGSITQLPAEIQNWLLENGPVSDRGGPFNPSDVVDAVNPVPGERLVSGLAGPDAVCLQIEHGGRGYHHVILQFQLAGGHWTMVSRTTRMPPAGR